MGFLLRLFSKNGLFLFFLFLQIAALVLIFSRNSMQQSWISAQTAAVNSWISGYIDEGTSYLKLKKINEDLAAQNKILLEQLYGKQGAENSDIQKVSDTAAKQIYTFLGGDIVTNSINRKNNYFTVNRGNRDGVSAKMGVIAPNGIAGIVINTTDSYALVQSVLSVNNTKINAALKNSGYFGTLTWKGDDSRIMHLAEIPKYVSVKVGDTVETDGKSAIFPKGIMVGTVAGYEVDSKTGFWDISVELSEKMGTLSKVYIIKSMKKNEVQQIQDSLQTAIRKEND
ncbi:MAG: rod shape-determining protein MreC [Flavobacteriaceae bacterium]|nr:rod shape-determining protein MreC [Flavobacteriaceae bacterium]